MTARPSSVSSKRRRITSAATSSTIPRIIVLQQLDYLAFIDIYHERIKAFHVKDAEFNPTGRQGVYSGYASWVERAGRFRSLGDGQVDFGGIFSKLAQYGYSSLGGARMGMLPEAPGRRRARRRGLHRRPHHPRRPKRPSTISPAAKLTKRPSSGRWGYRPRRLRPHPSPLPQAILSHFTLSNSHSGAFEEDASVSFRRSFRRSFRWSWGASGHIASGASRPWLGGLRRGRPQVEGYEAKVEVEGVGFEAAVARPIPAVSALEN